MLEAIIQDLIRKERLYCLPQGNPIKGLDNQYWLVFKHRDTDGFKIGRLKLVGSHDLNFRCKSGW